jgi:hypothetical protein
MTKVQDMMRTATQVLQAIEAKDADTVFTAVSGMYTACADGHAAHIFSAADAGKQ